MFIAIAVERTRGKRAQLEISRDTGQLFLRTPGTCYNGKSGVADIYYATKDFVKDLKSAAQNKWAGWKEDWFGETDVFSVSWRDELPLADSLEPLK